MLIEKVNGERYSQCRIPGIVITGKGTLLACYECRKTKSDWADIDIKIIRSTDDGEHWQTVTMICGDRKTRNNPVLFVKEEEIHFLFLENYRNLFHCVSTDDGSTFSAPREKKIDCPFFYNAAAVGPGHGIVHKGKMIVPIWFARNRQDPKAHMPSVIATIYSENGDTWHMGDLIGENILENPSECALAVTGEQRVLISIRNENACRRRAFALSDNGFGDWSEVWFHAQMPDPVCMGSMYGEDGKLYHINCDSAACRENLTVKISRDCFETFRTIFVDTPAGYSDIAVKNNVLYVLYERDCNNGGLYFKKIPL